MLKNFNFEVTDEFDIKFKKLILEIEKRYINLNKHSKLKVESWIRKLCQVTNNREWKKNRNLYSVLLLDMVLNNNFEMPFCKFANEGPLLTLSKSLVKSKLSNKLNEISIEGTEDNTPNYFSKNTDTDNPRENNKLINLPDEKSIINV